MSLSGRVLVHHMDTVTIVRAHVRLFFLVAVGTLYFAAREVTVLFTRTFVHSPISVCFNRATNIRLPLLERPLLFRSAGWPGMPVGPAIRIVSDFLEMGRKNGHRQIDLKPLGRVY
jgi:hypothetical protein